MDNFTPGPALIGGILIGAASVWLLAANGRIAGVSGILHGLVARVPGDTQWRAWFIAGLLAAGLLVGFGTRMGAGCTSGHGVCGLGRLSVRSLAAVVTFMLTGGIAVYVTRHVIGVPS